MGKNPSPDRQKTLFGFLFKQHLPLETETTLFILVSAMDIFMTWLLLWQGDLFVESNPIARYFLEGWGAKGFVGFKFSAVAVVCVIAQIIALQRRELAQRILNLGTLVVAVVVIYSMILLVRHGQLL